MNGERAFRKYRKINHAIAFANELFDAKVENIGLSVAGIGFTFMAYGCSGAIDVWERVGTTRNIIMRRELLQCQQTKASVSTCTIKLTAKL